MLGCSRQTVLNQIHRYEQEGILGLEDKPRSGARAKADANYITQLKKAIASNPPDLGYRFSVWSVERLQKHLQRQTGVELAPRYLNELMGKHDIVYRKPKHDLSHKQQPQEVEEKKQLLEFLKKTR
jgi:transposase